MEQNLESRINYQSHDMKFHDKNDLALYLFQNSFFFLIDPCQSLLVNQDLIIKFNCSIRIDSVVPISPLSFFIFIKNGVK